MKEMIKVLSYDDNLNKYFYVFFTRGRKFVFVAIIIVYLFSPKKKNLHL